MFFIVLSVWYCATKKVTSPEKWQNSVCQLLLSSCNSYVKKNTFLFEIFSELLYLHFTLSYGIRFKRVSGLIYTLLIILWIGQPMGATVALQLKLCQLITLSGRFCISLPVRFAFVGPTSYEFDLGKVCHVICGILWAASLIILSMSFQVILYGDTYSQQVTSRYAVFLLFETSSQTPIKVSLMLHIYFGIVT